MHNQEHYLDFPLQKNQNKHNPLISYVPQDQQGLFQLPRQLNNSPFMPNNHYHKSKLPTQSNHSISKFAFTETSTQDQKQDEQIVCQNVNFNQKKYYEQDGFMQEITEATFKPKDLKKQLQKIRDSNKHLRKILTDNIFKKQDKNINMKSSSIIRCSSKTKTKYQKILDEFFCKKDTKEAIKRKMSAQKISNYKLKLREDENILKEEEHKKYLNQRKKSKQNSIKQQLNTDRNEPQIIKLEDKPYKHLIKTFSVHELAREKELKNKPISVRSILDARKTIQDKQNRSSTRNIIEEGWLGMNFHQRQARSLQKRKQTENIGKELNLKKQSQGCTFKPIKTEFRPKKIQNTASSYAKRYFQKIKRY